MCYLESIKLGVTTVHTAIPPLANGSSQPSVFNILDNLDVLGYETDLDRDALQKVSDHLHYVARREGFPMGQVPEYDAGQYEHQIPGGVISNLKRQLAEIGLEHRLKDVINEVIRVRAELGYPIIVTPISQYVVTQATLNITLGERYKEVLDEIVKVVVGCYGPQAGTIDQNLVDRVNSLPIAEKCRDWHVARPSIKELRDQYGSDISDDELLLRILCPNQKDPKKAMHTAGPIDTYYPPPQKPLVEFIEGLIKQKKHAYIYFERDNFGIKLQRSSSVAGKLRSRPGTYSVANLKELFKKGIKPDSVADIKQYVNEGQARFREVSLSQSATHVSEDDIVINVNVNGGGGGVGDHLDRETETVLDDVKKNIFSLKMAEEVFGVVIDVERWAVDEKATQLRRKEILARRKQRGKIWEGQR